MKKLNLKIKTLNQLDIKTISALRGGATLACTHESCTTCSTCTSQQTMGLNCGNDSRDCGNNGPGGPIPIAG